MTAYLPKENKQYKTQAYWETRFDQEDQYEWLASFRDVQHLLTRFVAKESRILIVGCGNSNFSLDMYSDGFDHITNLDFSQKVIDRMRNKCAQDMPEMQWICADMTKLPEVFAAKSFDVVIDKAAMDALMCDEGDVWSPQESILAEAHAMCDGVSRVLTDDGLFIQISFGQPHFRKRFLLGANPEGNQSVCYGWSYSYHKIDVGLGYFFYVLQKKQTLCEQDDA